MTTIKSLRRAPHLLPQCSAKVGGDVTNITWRKNQIARNGRDPNLCRRNATVEIDGEPFCATHGGQRALEVLMEGNKT